MHRRVEKTSGSTTCVDFLARWEIRSLLGLARQKRRRVVHLPRARNGRDTSVPRSRVRAPKRCSERRLSAQAQQLLGTGARAPAHTPVTAGRVKPEKTHVPGGGAYICFPSLFMADKRRLAKVEKNSAARDLFRDTLSNPHQHHCRSSIAHLLFPTPVVRVYTHRKECLAFLPPQQASSPAY